MGKQKFVIGLLANGEFIDDAFIELDDAVIDAVDDDWRTNFYDLCTPQDIARHIAYNLFINHLRLSEMDGWADQPNSNARIIKYPDLDMDYWALTVKLLE